MSLPGPRFTYEDYKQLPEDKRVELIEGELLMTPAPTTRHQAILGELFGQIRMFARHRRLGQVFMAPVDVILSEENVVQPDLVFVSRERRHIVDPDGGINGAPDLAVEILSPRTAGRDRLFKRKLYAMFGVREYWIVDPVTRAIEVLVPGESGLETWRVFGEGTELSSPLFSEFTIAVSSVFEG
ncbi:MAG TPA: Uma2 family endonuclease [Symbiobacteriaceae bacterium]|jgi:Uma2 family endonuclease